MRLAVKHATDVEFAGLWRWSDPVKTEIAISYCLSIGTEFILEGNYDDARDFASFARYFEQYIAVCLHETQAFSRWNKIFETHYRTPTCSHW